MKRQYLKTAALLLSLVMIFGLAGCGQKGTKAAVTEEKAGQVAGASEEKTERPAETPAENTEKPAEEAKTEEPPKEEPPKEEQKTADFNVLEELRACPGIISAEPEEAPVQYEGRVKCWSIRYVSDDCEVTGYVAIPSKLEGDLISVPEEGIEGLVYCRGGNRDYSALTPLELCKQVATAGYAAFGSQYRGNKGGTGSEDFGGDDVHDVTNLIDIALELPFIKGEKVYLVGFSRGGMMAYRACQDYGDKIAACSINSGIADSYIMYESRGDDMKLVYHLLVGGGPEELPEEFDRRSATKWADEINVPLLIGQGTADVKVVPEQAYAMAEALKAADKTEGEDYRLVIFEGATHGLANTTFMKEQLDWFAGFPIE